MVTVNVMQSLLDALFLPASVVVVLNNPQLPGEVVDNVGPESVEEIVKSLTVRMSGTLAVPTDVMAVMVLGNHVT